MHRYVAERTFSIVLSQQTPKSTTPESPKVRPMDADHRTSPMILRRIIMAQLATMQTEVIDTLA